MGNPPAGNTRFKMMIGAIAIAAALGFPAASQALTFNLTSTGNKDADAGFRAAANYWESVFSDKVTVNITAGFSSLGSNVLGQASTSEYDWSYSATKTALSADRTSADDYSFVAGLPSGSTYSKYINGTVDSAGAAHVQSGVATVAITSANAKAIGLFAANRTGEDARITFSSNFRDNSAFDFYRQDGIDANKIDFVGLAIHEIGHAMGFVSGVDVLDGNYGTKSDSFFDSFTTVLDFTRCSATSASAGAAMDWTVGGSAKSFSIGGNCSAPVGNAWSTGTNNKGDGNQASHWKDNAGLGIMDPTAEPAGKVMTVTALDVQALDVIGWNRVAPVPEPSMASMLLLGTALIGVGAVRRRRNLVGT